MATSPEGPVVSSHALRSRQWLWLVIVLVVVAVPIGYWWRCWLVSPTTVFLIRHADRAAGNADDLHVPLGTRRALELVHTLGEAGIQAIYHSDTTRAQKTVQPLADHYGLAPISYPALAVDELATAIRTNRGGTRVLIVGHSNTVPILIEALGGTSDGDIPHEVYDDLFVVTMCRCTVAGPSVVNIKYGAATPEN